MFQFSYDYNTALPTKFEEVAVVVHYAVGDLNSIFTKAFLQILYDLNEKLEKYGSPHLQQAEKKELSTVSFYQPKSAKFSDIIS